VTASVRDLVKEKGRLEGPAVLEQLFSANSDARLEMVTQSRSSCGAFSINDQAILELGVGDHSSCEEHSWEAKESPTAEVSGLG